MSLRANPGPITMVLLLAVVGLAGAACTDERPGRPGPLTATGQGGGSFDAGFNPGPTVDPATCEEAAEIKSYVGCDFWPTVTGNNVWSIFDYAVVVANTGENTVDVAVSRAGTEIATATIVPDTLETIYLPWVPELKGPDADECGRATPIGSSVRLADAAYHLTATFPVIVYQFNALQYVGRGGPAGKDWSSCPGQDYCAEYERPIGCFSFTNDASLLLPSTALTGNYRITGMESWTDANIGAYITLTGTRDGTNVTVNMSATGQVLGGTGVGAISLGGTGQLMLNAGEVAQLVADVEADLSGSLVQADAPVQVVSGLPCIYIPFDEPACDHIEESVFPAETLGEQYFVVRPTGPDGTVQEHVVRIYGNVDGTQLSYPSGRPSGAPTQIDAGEMVDLGMVHTDFQVLGDQAFAVASFMLGGSIVDPGVGRGDPSQTLAVAVQQYRSKYVFLAPNDYQVNYVDVIQPMGAIVTLDGVEVAEAPRAIGDSGYGVTRIELSRGSSGAHLLESNSLVGIQVAGYGSYTSYHYPGGLDLKMISPPPAR